MWRRNCHLEELQHQDGWNQRHQWPGRFVGESLFPNKQLFHLRRKHVCAQCHQGNPLCWENPTQELVKARLCYLCPKVGWTHFLSSPKIWGNQETCWMEGTDFARQRKPWLCIVRFRFWLWHRNCGRYIWQWIWHIRTLYLWFELQQQLAFYRIRHNRVWARSNRGTRCKQL